MCHEDLWTNFVRTIGSVALTELTSLLCDTDPSVAYCILTYMPTVKGSSEERWAIYFNSVAEKNRFVKILSEVCTEYTGRELTTAKIGRFLSERCREGIKVIEKMVRPGVTWQSLWKILRKTIIWLGWFASKCCLNISLSASEMFNCCSSNLKSDNGLHFTVLPSVPKHLCRTFWIY